MHIDLAFLQRVVARCTPEFRLHPHDRYLPCSVEFFMQQSELHQHQADGTTQVLAPRGSLTGGALLRFQRAQPQGSWLQLALDPVARGGAPVYQLPTVPVYVCVKAVTARDGSGHVEALEVTYITLFAFNGEYTVAGVISTGAHDGDIEHVTARVHPTSGELLGMWYNSHRPRDGEWVGGPQVPRTAEGRPIAYVALHGHGNYPRPCTVLRHFFLGNDRCGECGPVWRPDCAVLLPSTAAPPGDGDSDCGDTGEAPEVWEVVEVASRGSLFPSAARVGAPEGPQVAVCSKFEAAAQALPSTPQVVCGPCHWVHFRGLWGTTQAPREQSWFRMAESPASRTPLQRVFCHLWPEVASV